MMWMKANAAAKTKPAQMILVLLLNDERRFVRRRKSKPNHKSSFLEIRSAPYCDKISFCTHVSNAKLL